MSLSKFQEIMEDRGAQRAADHGLQRIQQHNLATEQQQSRLWVETEFQKSIICLINIIAVMFVLKLFGEGNGNPLWYSCLKNSMDRPRGWKESDPSEWLTLATFTFIMKYLLISFRLYNSVRVTIPLFRFIFATLCEVKWKSFSCVWLFVIPWTIQSMEFSRPEYWSG